MKVVVDTHVHMYPFYDAGRAVANLTSNLGRLCPGAVQVACLVERSDCNWFEELAGKAGFVPVGYRSELCGNERAVALHPEDGAPLYVLPGRQIVTRERIELLCLTSEPRIPDGVPASKAVEDIVAGGGVPVVGWAPGKWFFSRGAVVQSIVDEFGAKLAIGDTSLRARGWPEPALMKTAGEHGIAVLAGSDPLPFEGEEEYFGVYGCVMDCEFDARYPVSSVKSALMSRGAGVERRGRRCGVFEMLRRIRRNARAG